MKKPPQDDRSDQKRKETAVFPSLPLMLRPAIPTAPSALKDVCLNQLPGFAPGLQGVYVEDGEYDKKHAYGYVLKKTEKGE